MQCSSTCGSGQQEMQFICVSKEKIGRVVADSATTSIANLTDPASTTIKNYDNDDERSSTAFGLVQRQTETITRHQWSEFVCGPKPETLIRPCSGPQCSPPSASAAVLSNCSDGSPHCQLPGLHRYCVLPHFRIICCQLCANYLS